MTVSCQTYGCEAAETLSQMYGQCFEAGRIWSAAEIISLLQSPGASSLIISEDGQPAGFMIWRVIADEAEIITLALLPLFRARGLGRKILQAFTERVQAQGVRAVFLEVRADNLAAKALYAQAGYKLVGRRADYYGDAGDQKQDALIMKSIWH